MTSRTYPKVHFETLLFFSNYSVVKLELFYAEQYCVPCTKCCTCATFQVLITTYNIPIRHVLINSILLHLAYLSFLGCFLLFFIVPIIVAGPPIPPIVDSIGHCVTSFFGSASS